jgi:acetyl-CoA synthetase
VESALVAHESVAEAAVVGFPHPIKGQGIYAYVSLTADSAGVDREQIKGALKEQVRHVIGSFASPDVIHVASGLPKTRSGKIMRRILRKIAASEYDGLGDVTTLAEPEVVERLIEEHKTRRT